MLSAYQLRQHLAQWHGIRLVGLDYDSLVTVHDIEHRSGQDHDHHEGGHADLTQILYLVLLLVFIVVLLRLLGVAV